MATYKKLSTEGKEQVYEVITEHVSTTTIADIDNEMTMAQSMIDSYQEQLDALKLKKEELLKL